MFDFSFTELMVVGAVALIVIGPEKLPKVARTIGHLVGRMQRYVTDVKSDINREMEFEELRRLRKEMNEAASEVETSARQHASDIRTGLDGVAKAADVTAEEAAASPAAKADAGLTPPTEGTSPPAVATQVPDSGTSKNSPNP
jgi:sec-independent protein translocase protein TatB